MFKFMALMSLSEVLRNVQASTVWILFCLILLTFTGHFNFTVAVFFLGVKFCSEREFGVLELSIYEKPFQPLLPYCHPFDITSELVPKPLPISLMYSSKCSELSVQYVCIDDFEIYLFPHIRQPMNSSAFPAHCCFMWVIEVFTVSPPLVGFVNIPCHLVFCRCVSQSASFAILIALYFYGAQRKLSS